MEVLLLGTGAADGIPNPFCRCATCTDHRERRELRTPTSVLIDGRLLVDPGPEAPRQVSRFGRDLTG
ncbi:MAG TPA: cobalamin biosynthesis protein CobU, partial [Propionicimonas sp.]|nr:cobalamin biosynthesis protein CobU [Propionicimonas sp.]